MEPIESRKQNADTKLEFGADAMKTRLIWLWALFAIAWQPAAHAQMTLDVAKMTCNQFLLGQVSDSRTMSIWLLGYYHGMHSNTVIDVAATEKRAYDLVNYCMAHYEENLMSAAKNILGENK
jgi:acid stress chaperone HdeB